MISQIMMSMQKKDLAICLVIKTLMVYLPKKGKYGTKLKWSYVWQNNEVYAEETLSNMLGYQTP